MTDIFDYLVVGSGCTGAMAAQTLIEAGVKVTMLDAGIEDRKYKGLIPDSDFVSIRENENNQHRYFIGDDFESISFDESKTGSQLTPPRKFILDQVDTFLKVSSENFFPMESLAYGGLGNAWGLGCCTFSSSEMQKTGMDFAKMKDAYKTIAARIGISGEEDDDISKYTHAGLFDMDEAMKIDSAAGTLYQKYLKNKQSINENGLYMGKPSVAVITKDRENRRKMSYRDLDFYSDMDKSAWRPWVTVDELEKKNNFQLIKGILVTDFEEKDGLVIVNCLNILSKEKISYSCKNLVLSPGVLGTARIVLRSLGSGNEKLPLICNPYCYVPCLQPVLAGKGMAKNISGLVQLSVFCDENGNNDDVAMASVYNYRSLMLFRIVKYAPLNFVDSRIFLQWLLPGITIMGIHHPEYPGEHKYIKLSKDNNSYTGDTLFANYSLNEEEQRKVDNREKKFFKMMRKLGNYPLKRINPGHGSSIHYAGALPFDDTGKPFTLNKNGLLSGTRNVYVADGSGLKYLPAKGLTLSLMANAHYVASQLINSKQ